MSKFRIQDIFSLAALVIVAVFLFGLSFGEGAEIAGDKIPGRVIQAELPVTQPTLIVDFPDQWLARYELTTDSAETMPVEGVVIYLQGSLGSQVVKYPTLYPLTVLANSEKEVMSMGDLWIYTDGYISQEIIFTEPLMVNYYQPVELDVYANLTGQEYSSIRLTLGEVISDYATRGLPLEANWLTVTEGGLLFQ